MRPLFTAYTVAAAPSAAYEKQYKVAVTPEISGEVVGTLAGLEAIRESARDYDTKLRIATCKKKLGRLHGAAWECGAGPSSNAARHVSTRSTPVMVRASSPRRADDEHLFEVRRDDVHGEAVDG